MSTKQLPLALVLAFGAVLALAACGGSSTTLSVQKQGTGTGSVSSAPAGIDCGGTCTATFKDGAEVVLTATPDAGSSFDRWAGDCSGVSTTCTFKARGAQAVIAVFTLAGQTDKPGKPGNVTATAGDGQATATWTAPADDGGRPLTGFLVTSTPAGGSTSVGPGASTAVVAGLVNGTTYTLSVVAQNAIASSDPAESAPFTPRGKPGQVATPTAVSGDAKVTLTWTAPGSGGSPITGYTVTASPGDATRTTAATTLELDGLTNGTAYTFTVFATNALGNGPPSAATAPATPSTTPAAPAQPVAVALVRSATLTWTAPDDGGQAITGYQITQSTGGAYTAATAAVTGTEATVTGFPNGATMTFKVAAQNGRGTGPESVASEPVTLPALPGTPADVVATRGDATASVAWTAPASASPILKYVVRVWNDGTSQSTLWDGDATTATVVTGLTNGTSYSFSVFARTIAGDGAESARSASVVPSGPVSAPGDVTATRGDGSIAVTWTAPTQTGGTAVASYTITATPGTGAATTASAAGTATTATVTGLVNGTSYTVSVFATNGAGPGPSASAPAAVIPAGLPAAPALTGVAPLVRAATVTFAEGSDNGDAITGHVVEVSTGAGYTAIPANQLDFSVAGQVGISGLSNGGTYTFRISATNGVGTGLPSNASAAITLIDVPGPVTGLAATPGELLVDLSWVAPLSTGGSPLTGYGIHVTPHSGTPAPYDLTAAADATGLHVTGLALGASYTFAVVVNNLAGSSAAVSVITAIANPPDAPGKPAVTSTPPKSAVLAWAAPASDGGSPITAYLVYQRATGDAGFTRATAAVDLTARTATVTGLVNATAYLFTVSAVNDRAEGPQSAASDSATTPDVPGAPAITDVAASGPGNAALTWTAPASDGGAPILRYAITATPVAAGAILVREETSSAALSGIVHGLRNGFAYTFTVTAINGAGEGPASASSGPFTPVGPPEAPSISGGTAGIRSLTLTFDAPAVDGGSPLTGYLFEASTDSGLTFAPLVPTVPANPSLSTQTVAFAGLLDGTTYVLRVSAINALGTGPASANSEPLATPKLPKKPVFSPVVKGDTELTLAWSDAAQDPAYPITSYSIVQVAPAGGTFTSAVPTLTVTGLVNGTEYSFTVQATSAVGLGPVSDPSAPTAPHVPCGDGRLTPGEECDQSAPDNVYACDATCHYLAGTCGDGARNFGEACDDGNQIPGDGCEFDCTPTSCGTTLAVPAVATDVCELSAAPAGADGSKLLRGTVLASVDVGGREHEKVFGGGEVLVDAAGKISCAGCSCAGATGYDKARVLTCAAGVISPGLINPHDHITYQKGPATNQVPNERYEHRNDWRIDGKYNGHHGINSPGGGSATWGELRQLIAGTTSVAGSGGGKGLLRNIDALSTGTGDTQEGLGEGKGVNFETFPLSDQSGKANPLGTCTGYTVDAFSVIPYDSGYLPHVGEGIDLTATTEFECFTGATGFSTAQNLLTRKTSIIHGIGFTPAQISRMAAKGSSLIWSPRSNVSLYGDTARIQEYRRLGVNIALGTDWLESGSMNELRELRCAESFASGYTGLALTDVDYFRMVTASAADALQVEEKIGRIAPGKVADLAVFRLKDASRPYRAILDADPEDVLLTMRGGTALFGETTWMNAAGLGVGTCESLRDLAALAAQTPGCSLVNYLRTVCGVTEETGSSAATLAGAALYPLAFCAGATPDSEPSCQPKRDNGWCTGANCQAPTYTGVPSAGDQDGDGVPDATDNCPTVFNPVRPQDCATPGSTCTQQADQDGDGIGDACDLCPTVHDDGLTPCPTVPDPRDQDGDGVDNGFDACPSVASAGPADVDANGFDDACDPCLGGTWTAATSTCATNIYGVKARFPNGDDLSKLTSITVTLEGIVTGAAAGKGFFLQVDPATASYPGPDHSGVYYFTALASPAVGSKVTVTGAKVADYYGQTQLSGGTFASVASTATIPPTDALVSEVRTGGARAQALEAVLVNVTDSPRTVTSITPSLGARDIAPSNEYVVGGTGEADGLRVNDLFFVQTPFPAIDAALLSLQGILELRNGNSKLEPRSSADADFGPNLSALGPAGQFTRTRAGNTTGPSFPQALVVTLASTRGVDTVVHVRSLSADLSLNGSVGNDALDVTVLKNTASAVVPMVGLLKNPAAQLEAWTVSEASALTQTVAILDGTEVPAVVSLSPSAAPLYPGQSLTLTVALDLPGLADAGLVVPLVYADASKFEIAPATVTVLKEQSTATFVVKAAAASNAGATTIGAGASPGAAQTATITFQAGLAECVKGQVVISQAYGGGGNGSGASAAYYKYDYVELFNRSSSDCTMTNWSLQRQSAAGVFTSAVDVTLNHTFSGTILAHRYFLVREAAGANAAANELPAPDVPGGGMTMSATAAKVVLVSGALLTSCPAVLSAGYVDLVAYGAATVCFESAPVAALTNTTVAVRKGDGCTDTDSNVNDFDIKTASGDPAAVNAAVPSNSSVTGPICP